MTHADAVLQVLDGTSPSVAHHADTVDQVLLDLGAAEKPRVVAVNKVDLLGPQARRRLLSELAVRYPTVTAVSAMRRTGLDELMALLEDATAADTVELEVLVPYGQEAVLAGLRELGGVEGLEYSEDGTRAWGRVPARAAGRFSPYRVDRPLS